MPKKKKEFSKKPEHKLQDLRLELKDVLIERSDEIDGALTALLAKEHVLLLGPPGAAKTLLTSLLSKALDSSYFEWLMSKFTVPEELFGSFSIQALKNDKHERVIDGKLPEAQIAFLDEIFKANSSILNSLLTLINERRFFNGGKAINCPLETMVGASNELPESKELDALYDRFLLRYWVDYIDSMDSFKRLLISNKTDVKTKLSIKELHALQDAVEKVNIPDSIFDLIITLKLALEKEGFYSSDRRWKKALTIIKAYAFLNCRSTVSEDDLLILKHVLWNDPKDRAKLAFVISRICSPLQFAAS